MRAGRRRPRRRARGPGVRFAHLRDQVLRGDPASGRVCVAIDLARLPGSDPATNLPTSVRIARGFGPWEGWLFAVEGAGEIWAQDIGLAPAPTPAREADRTTPLPGGLALALVALAARARRRSHPTLA